MHGSPATADRRLEALLALHRRLADGADLPEVTRQAVADVGALLEGTAALWLTADEPRPDGGTEEVIRLAAYHHPDPALAQEMTEVVGDGVLGAHSFVRMVIDGGTPLLLDRAQVVAGLPLMEPAYRDFFARHPPSAMLLQPLLWKGGAIGLLGVARELDAPPFDDADVVLVSQASQVLTVALHAARLLRTQVLLLEQARLAEERLALLARTDDLTGLPNRRGFLHDLASLDPGTRGDGALVVLDLDDFKEVNDTFGHSTGDAVLIGFAARLQDALPAPARLARLGGDEFAVVLLPAPARDLAADAGRLVQLCGTTVVVAGVTVPVRASAGFTLLSGPSPDIGRALRQADVALYRAKRERTALAVFDGTTDHRALSRLRDAARLRTGLASGELVVHYQRVLARPEGDLAVFACEALVRWQREDLLVAPDDFLPLVRDLGALPELTRQVATVVVAQIAAWRAAGLHPRVAVNVPASVLVGGFPEQAAALLDAHELPRSCLSVEVTEGEMVDTAARRALLRCRALGMTVAIDDFGTGFSALGYLVDLPLDALKIDRSLVRGLDSDPARQALLRLCVAFAHETAVAVVAEGVETAAELATVLELGVDWVQGFHLHRPCAAQDLTPVTVG